MMYNKKNMERNQRVQPNKGKLQGVTGEDQMLHLLLLLRKNQRRVRILIQMKNSNLKNGRGRLENSLSLELQSAHRMAGSVGSGFASSVSLLF